MAENGHTARSTCEAGGEHLAEGVGFEPTEAFTSHAFEACPFGRSGTLPGRQVSGIRRTRHRRSRILKVSSGRAENLVMQVDLFDNGAGTGPRPAWQVIEAARRRYLTGLLVLETTPPTHVYLRDGQVYFAERTTDGGLGVRLLVEGVISREQMHKATLQVSGVEHLGRMFERDETIDREAVELCVELMTDDVLTHVADTDVAAWRMKMYQRHPSGLDRWLPTRVEVITHLVDTPAAADPEAEVTPSPAPRPRPQLAPPPITAEVPVAVADLTPTAPMPRPAVDPTPVSMPAPLVPPPSLEVPVVGLPSTEVPVVDPAAAAPRPFVPDEVEETAVVEHVEATLDPDPTPVAADATPIGLAPAAMDALMSGSIKDEVADAVRRALASIDH